MSNVILAFNSSGFLILSKSFLFLAILSSELMSHILNLASLIVKIILILSISDGLAYINIYFFASSTLQLRYLKIMNNGIDFLILFLIGIWLSRTLSVLNDFPILM